jgi:hypothetical protein
MHYFFMPAAFIKLSETTAEGKASQAFLTGFGRSSIMATLGPFERLE